MTNSKTTNKFLEDALKQINQARDVGNSTLTPTAFNHDPSTAGVMRAVTVANSAIERVAGMDTTYRKQAEAINQQFSLAHWGNLEDRLRHLLGLLSGMAHDFENGNVTPFEELARAEVFTDFLDMADHLLTQGYKDPAAVLIGGVLEDHIKKLCPKFNVSLTAPKASGKDDRELTTGELNIELRKAGAYSLAEQKSVDAQLAIRNDAAHADWGKYTIEQVRLMYAAVRQFIAAHC